MVLLYILFLWPQIQQILPSFLSPSFITGDSLRPDLVLITKNSTLYILELTLGFESNIQINSDRKASKYSSIILDLKHAYSDVKFVNLSMSTLGIMGRSSESLLLMLEDLKLDKNAQKHIIRKIINIAIRCSYYVFFRRKKSWTSSDLLDFLSISYLSLHSILFPPLYCNIDKLIIAIDLQIASYTLPYERGV